MSAKAAQADLYPLARPYFLFWLPNAADQYNQSYLAGSPIGMASDDPTAARNPTTGALLAAGSLVAGTDGILYVVDTSGVPQPQPYLSGALTWTALQTFAGGIALLDGDTITLGTGADVILTPDGTNVVLSGAGALLAHDTKFLIVDPADTTKRARLDAGGVTAGQTRVVNLPDQNVGLSGVVYASTAASTAITGTTETETAFDTSYTFAANTIKAGMTIRIQGQGICTATTGSETHTIAVKLGSVTLLFKAAIDPANNDIWWFDVTVSVRTVGAGGTVVACGMIALGASDTAAPVLQNTASSTLDTTATAVCACYIDRQAGATDSDSARLDQFVVTVSAPPAAV